LHVKPVLTLKGGRIETLATARTKAKAQDSLLELMGERAKATTPVHVAIFHAQALSEARALERQVRERFTCREVLFSELGPVLGAHIGPGAVGLAFYKEVGPASIRLAQKWEPNKATAPAAGELSEGSLASRPDLP
jgi:fatty acid-binding protein DegV